MRTLVTAIVCVVSGGWIAAGQQRVLTPPPPTLAERPERLMQAQRLVWEAYPELREKGLQFRVIETAEGVTVTIGEARKDREDLLGLSRPRAALLVGTFAFDINTTLQRAILNGTLTHLAERRRIRELSGGWTAALEAEKASFAPGKQTELLQQLNLVGLRKIVGTIQLEGAQFQAGTMEEPLYWDVTARTATGETVRLEYEPYQGRLVRFERGIGGGQ